MAKEQGKFAIEIEPAEFKDLLGVLRTLDKEQSARLREGALPLSKRLEGQLKMFALAAPAPQTKLLVDAIQAKKDRLVRVDVGGPKKVGRPYRSRETKKLTKAPAGALLWGTEYGSTSGTDSLGRKYSRRFVVGRNKGGYWINPAVDFYGGVVAKEYATVLTMVIKENRLD